VKGVRVIGKMWFYGCCQAFLCGKNLKREGEEMTLKKHGIVALVTIMVLVLCVGSYVPVAASDLSGSPEYTPGLHTG